MTKRSPIYGEIISDDQFTGVAKTKIKCPYCFGTKTWKDGLRKTSQKTMQRYLCRDCGFRFSEQ